MNFIPRAIHRSVLLLLICTLFASSLEPLASTYAQEIDPTPVPLPTTDDSANPVSGSTTVMALPGGEPVHEPEPISGTVTAPSVPESTEPVLPFDPALLEDTSSQSPASVEELNQQAEIAQTNQLGVQVNVIAVESLRLHENGVNTGAIIYTILYTNTLASRVDNVWIQVGLASSVGLSTSSRTLNYSATLEAPAETPQGGSGPKSSEPITVTTGSVINNLFWRVGSLDTNRNGRIVFVISVSPDLYPRSMEYSSGTLTTTKPTILTASVAIYKDGGDPTKGEAQFGIKQNEGAANTLVLGPVLWLNKVVAQDKLLAGQQVTFNIGVGNATSAKDFFSGKRREDVIAATGITLTDQIPSNAQFVSATNNGTFDSQNGRVSWNIPSLGVGQVITVSITMILLPNTTTCDKIENSVYTATSNEYPLIGTPARKATVAGKTVRATLQVPVQVGVTYTPSSVLANERATIQISVTNFLSQSVSGISLTLVNQNPVVIGSQSGPAGTVGEIDNNTNTVIWRNLTLAPGSLANPSITKFAATIQYDRIIGERPSTATVFVPAPLPQTCIKPDSVKVDVKPLIVLSKKATPEDIQIGGETRYRIEVKNVSNQSVSNLVLTETLPFNQKAIFQYKGMVSGQPPDQALNENTELVWRFPGTLAAGSSYILEFTAQAFGIGGANACYQNILNADSDQSQVKQFKGADVCLLSPFEIDKVITPAAVDPDAASREVVVTVRIREVYRPPNVRQSGGVAGVWLKDDPNTVDFGGQPSTKPNSELVFLQVISSTNNISGSTVVDTDGGVYWNNIPLQQGAGFTVALRMTIPGARGTGQGTQFTDRACIGYEPRTEGTDDPRTNFSWCIYDDALVVLNKNTIKVSKTVNPSAKASLGQRVEYTLSYQNESPNNYTSVTLSDTLPVGFRYDGVIAGAPAPTVTALDSGRQLLVWSNQTLSAKATKTLKFYARTPNYLVGSYLNEAWGSAPGTTTSKPTFICSNEDKCNVDAEGPYASTVVLPVVQLITLEPEVVTATSQLQPNGIIEYKISLINVNTIAYNSTTITATLPGGMTYDSMIDGVQPDLTLLQTQPDKLVWRNVTVPAAPSTSVAQVVLRMKLKLPNRNSGSYRVDVEANSPTGTIPTVNRGGPIVLDLKTATPELSMSPPSLRAVLGGDIKVTNTIANPTLNNLEVVSLTTTLPPGLEYKGMVLSDTLQPEVTGNITTGQVLTWKNIRVNKAPSESDTTYSVLDFRVKPSKVGTYALRSSIVATGVTVSTQQANTSLEVINQAEANRRYLRLPLIVRLVR